MATLTVYSDTADGYIQSSAGTYSDARSGSNLVAQDGTNTLITGQTVVGGDPFCYEIMLGFDTSSIPSGSNVSAAALSLYGTTDQSTTDFTAEARLHDWGAGLTTGDWVAGADLSGKTLLATFATSGGWSTTGYNTFSENGSNFQDNVNLSGDTRLLVNSSRHRVGTAPSGTERVIASSADESGTTQDPKLVVTYTEDTGLARSPNIHNIPSVPGVG